MFQKYHLVLLCMLMTDSYRDLDIMVSVRVSKVCFVKTSRGGTTVSSYNIRNLITLGYMLVASRGDRTENVSCIRGTLSLAGRLPFTRVYTLLINKGAIHGTFHFLTALTDYCSAHSALHAPFYTSPGYCLNAINNPRRNQ